jgi:integrase
MSLYKSGFSHLIEKFIHYRKASGSWNESSYGLNIKLFDHFCADNYPNTELYQEMVDNWCKKRCTESNTSCNTRTQVVSTFIDYLQKRELTTANPVMPLKSEKKKHIPHAFTNEELKRFFYECDNIIACDGRLSSVLRTITCPTFFRLLYSSGIRTIEARYLQRNEVDLIHGVLNIRQSKGYDQHYVALHESMTELLKLYDQAANKLQPNRKFFFKSIRGEHYSRAWVADNFKLLWLKSNGASNRVVAYALRHNYATTNINSWVNDSFEATDKLHYLSKSMGHRWIKSTLYYYTLVPRLADTLLEKTNKSFNAIVPEVCYEEEQ